MERKIESAVLENGMAKAYENVIIGFSGGADSSALVHYFSKRAKSIVCVHINHMIRGAEADRDEELCRKKCEEYKIPFVSYKIDIPALSAKTKQGLEQTARDERYRVFNEECDKRGFDAILTAHNANDNTESVIFNLVRGSGANGASGIKPVNGRVLRPLIYATREEILSYCEKNNIEYVTDSTNENTDYTRNYIRHKVVPMLEALNPSLNNSVSRLSTSLRADEDFILSQARKFISEHCKDGKIRKTELDACHESVKIRVLKILSGKNLDYKSIRACLDFIPRSQSGGVINLCKGASLKREKDYLTFVKTKELESAEFCLPLKKGITTLDDIGVIVALDSELSGKEPYETVCLNSTSINGELYVRSKRDGDIIKHAKMTKKLKKLMCEKGIPSHKRDKIPLLCDASGIVAIPELAIRDHARGNDIIIRFYKGE